MAEKQKIINIAVIAHVDAGKSTLVDALLAQSHVFRENEQIVDCVMDSDAIERERGITIYSKNCSIMYKDIICPFNSFQTFIYRMVAFFSTRHNCGYTFNIILIYDFFLAIFHIIFTTN